MVKRNDHVITFKLDEHGWIVSRVDIATPIYVNQASGSIGGTTTFSGPEFKAPWDTGATKTVVVPRVIKRIALASHGFCEYRGVDGIPTKRPVYLASIAMGATRGILFHSTEIVELERDDQLAVWMFLWEWT